MSRITRYAVYVLPDDPALARFGAEWLGWDVVAAAPVAQTDDWQRQITDTPRRYGFHATLKPPFALRTGTDEAALSAALADLAAQSPGVRLPGLRLARLGRFLALVPDGGAAAVSDLAARCVTGLDTFRAPPGPAEIARRRPDRMTAEQRRNFEAWGYPHVLDLFRFHITLTGRLPTRDLDAAQDRIAALLPPLPRPFGFAHLSLVAEGEDGFFRLLHRVPLTGQMAPG